MNIYQVREGHTFGPFNEHQAGDQVELLEAEAKPFLDKLAFVGKVEETQASPTSPTSPPAEQLPPARPPAAEGAKKK